MNSPIINSAIGDGNNVVMGNDAIWYGETGSASLDDLRELIALLREEVEAADGGKPADNRIQYELGIIKEELDDDDARRGDGPQPMEAGAEATRAAAARG